LQYARRYCSRVALALSVCLSICGWKAVLRLRDIPSASVTHFQKSEVNRDPLSDIILLGNPWGLITCWRKRSARSLGFMVPWQATKCPIFVRRSIITHNASFPLLVGSVLIKSIDIVSLSWCGSSSGFSSPNGVCQIGLMRWQVSQWSTYLWTYFHGLGQ